MRPYRRRRDIASGRAASGLIDDVLERPEGLVEPLLPAAIFSWFASPAT
jgi:hypothetical protein